MNEPMISPRSERSQRPTREKLIIEAMVLFQSRGYHAIGINEILKAAGVPKGSLYHHFPGGKEMLAVSTVEWLVEKMVTHFNEAALSATNPAEFITALFENTHRWLVKCDYRQGALLPVLAQEITPEEKHLFKAITKGYRNSIASLTLVLGPSEHNQGLAQTLLCTLDGAIAMSRVSRSPKPLQSTVATLLPLLDQNQKQS